MPTLVEQLARQGKRNKCKALSIRLREDTYNKYVEAASKAGCSLNDLFCRVLDRAANEVIDEPR